MTDTVVLLPVALAVSGEVFDPMYEHYLTAFRNGVTDIDVSIDEEALWEDFELDDTQDRPRNGIEITVTFAVTTDSEAWITITGDGTVHPAFGGTGVTDEELDAYAEQAVEIWRATTGDNDTTCRYVPKTTTGPDSQGTIVNA